jgi:biopolymer transport protein ExbB
MAAATPAIEPGFESLLEDKGQVLKSEMEVAEAGDLKEFTVITDDDITALEVGDIYKNNTSFFKVKAIRSKGTAGGEFVVQRSAGKLDPGRKWNRVSGLGPLTIAGRETLMDRFLSGGVLMYPIALLLLVTLVVAFNSLWVYRRNRQCPAVFVQAAREAIAKGDVERFQGLALSERGLLAAVCRAMTAHLDTASADELRMQCEAEAMRQISLLRIPLKGLNFIAVVAPLLGLLGTVVGMVMCFESLAEEAASAGKAQALAAGIKVALLTTVAGLCVAIPALTVFFIFNSRLNMIVADCEGLATEFANHLAAARRKNGAAGATTDPSAATRAGTEGRP